MCVCVCVHLVGPALCVSQGKVRLLLDTVQVLVEPVQQEGQQLLGVLLLEAVEPGGVLRYRPLIGGERRGINTFMNRTQTPVVIIRVTSQLG